MDLYNIPLVSAEKEGGTKVLIQAPTGHSSVNAVLDAIPSGNPHIGLLFDRYCEHFNALEFSSGARVLLAGFTEMRIVHAMRICTEFSIATVLNRCLI